MPYQIAVCVSHGCNRIARLFALLSVVVAIGCGSGSGGSDSSGIGSGQDPDPVVVDFPLLYVERPLLTDTAGNLLTADVRRQTDMFPGAQLIVRDRASPSAPEQVLTSGIFPDDADGNPPQYDVKDLAVSFDGRQAVFAMRAPMDPNLDPEDQPTWNIWLFDLDTNQIGRVINSDIVAEDGQDLAPAFLPDGRIVFTSTRQRQSRAILLDEGKPQFSALDEDRRLPALNLHVMESDGSELKQVTFNASSDLDPVVFDDGRVVYARWDNVAGNDQISLYSVNPDGTQAEALYGTHSHDTGPNGEGVEFTDPQPLPDGRLLSLLRTPGAQSRMGTLPVAIDVANFVEHDQPTNVNAGLLSDAQEFLIDGDLNLDETTPATQGRYAHVVPLYDGSDRLLVSWSQCRLVDVTSDPNDPRIVPCSDENLANPNMVEADPLYGVWINDVIEGTQQPIVVGEQGIAFAEAVIMEPRTAPPVILDGTPGIDLDIDLASESVGVVHIRSVYDFDGVASQDLAVLADPAATNAAARPARFVRVVKSVGIPDDDVLDVDATSFGRSSAQSMREILGYAPVHPDGSVKLKVPANVPFWFDVLDAQGRRLGERHNNWMQVIPGEEAQCNGCHSSVSEAPHGRMNAQAPSANAGAPVDGSPFPNTDPVLFANAGETMAEVFTRINGVPEPDLDVRFDDVWTDPVVRLPDASTIFAYADLSTPAPVETSCTQQWRAACRVVINYETHIHPLWGLDRQEFAADGVTLIRDDTCTACHSNADAAGAAMVPIAQLDLSDGPSADEADHFKSYRELLFDDNEQELSGVVLQDRLVPVFDGNGNPVFETDGNGDLILDAGGNPIQLMQPIGIGAILNVAGAVASPGFFALFEPGASHEARLTPAELRLVSEWIDIGGQYYNNPFAVPP